ncbi:anti-sigma factor domain-containing protein [Arthrobacter sp. U41]|uniref:anti-sigma factor domain-containing protein n=1 Tax=Arthrobacter sp. U41 TaxID=1849032 RepID=UPI00085945EB|nr:anti-sigma factor [Arthrobacter sp. U41]AOT02768.1 anti-sigma factor [Arthrobacter sp. U41]
MQHLDPESLSLLALGEELGDDAADHLRSCASCASEYMGLRRAVVAAKPGPDAATLESPGPQVWAGIHSALGLSTAVAADPLDSPTASGTRPAPLPLPPSSSVTPLPTREERAGRKQEPGGGSGWLRRPGVWLAAAAATALLAGGVFWSVQQSQPAVTPLARAELAPVDQHSATGSARVVEAKDGQRTLEVRVDKVEARGYQEVWLIAPDLTRLVSLGVMTSESGTFAVPAGLDLGEFPIVDVSDEPVDGNPAHSSVSIVRGTLAS